MLSMKKLTNINIPIFLVSGKNDAVGSMGKAVIELSEYFESINESKTEIVLYNSRHEVLHDKDSEKIKRDILKIAITI